jgi:putative phage-type endonuclease
MIEQRTDAWFLTRLGKITASRISDVMAKTKNGPSVTRNNYLTQLVCERLTGVRAESFTNAAMEWGTATEPMARDAYSAKTGELVTETGFHDHPTIPMSGASPDGLVGIDGLVELKCPSSSVMLDLIYERKIQTRYLLQMQWQMSCANKYWCDFASYDPRLPAHLRLLVIRVKRDDALIATIETEVKNFLAEIELRLESLQKAKL